MREVLLRAGMFVHGLRHWRPVERMAQHPDAAQWTVLQRMLSANRDTRFGKEHGFSDIRDLGRFRERVPVQDYETLRPYIDEQRRAGTRALTAEAPLFYAQTSGTTGVPKCIPITPSALAMHRAEQALFTYLQYRACPQAFSGKALGIMGAAVEDVLDTGHAVGSVSGHLYQSLPGAVQARFVVPPAVAGIADYALKYLVILRLALAEPGISYLGSPNPSTFLRLLDVLNQQRDTLMRSLATGRLDELDALDASLRQDIVRRLRPMPERVRHLQGLADLDFANVWPGIRLVTTWTGGSCGIALDSLRRRLPPRAQVMELGYQATEWRGTLALQPETPGGLPSLHHHYMEFVEQARWDDGNPEFLTLERLEPGRRYYILVTTAAGLYRYFMNDLVEVTGYFRCTPLLRFVQKGRGVTSLTGEKLYEVQAIEAVQDGLLRSGVLARFFLLVADETRSAYRLYIESEANMDCASALAADIERGLGERNIEYRAKRESGRLGPLSLVWLKPGTAEAHKAACVRAGQREGQFKAAVLQYRTALPLPLDDYVIRWGEPA